MSTMTAKDLAHGLFRVLETGDVELARRIVGPDNHNREANVAPPACSAAGPAGTVASSTWLRSAFSGLILPISDIAEGPDEVWVRLRIQGRHDGPFVRYHNGKVHTVLPPTGRQIDVEQIHVLKIRNGQVTDHQSVRDDVTMLEQLGAFPPGPAFMARMVQWRVTGRAARAAEHVATAAAAAATATN